MFVVIFRAKTTALDSRYSEFANQLRDKALNDYHCIEFVSAHENGDEIALSYWNNEDDIIRWKKDAEHLAAQQLGKQAWYENYRVEVCEIQRSYSSKQ
jgi:heme-degrading monooxygenase HmoA